MNRKSLKRQTSKVSRFGSRSVSRNRRISKKQRGGIVLGEGTYGCVVQPNISCPNSPPSKNLVSKIVSTEITDLEYPIIDDLGIMEVEDYEKYFATITDSCPLDAHTTIPKTQKDDYTKCTLKNPTGTFMNYVQPFGGMSFRKYRLLHKNQGIREMIPYYYQLFEILRVLQKNDIVHRDIKPDNIVINPQEGRLRLIDFGISHHISEKHNMDRPDLYANDYPSVYNSGYYIWPIEINLFQYQAVPIIHEGETYNIAKIADKLRLVNNDFIRRHYTVLENYMLRNFTDNLDKHPYRPVYLDSCNRIYKRYTEIMRYASQKDRERAISRWKNIANSALDLYSVGVVILEDITTITKDGIDLSMDGGLIDDLIDLLLSDILQQDSNDRISVEDAYKEFVKICNKHAVSLRVEIPDIIEPSPTQSTEKVRSASQKRSSKKSESIKAKYLTAPLPQLRKMRQNQRVYTPPARHNVKMSSLHKTPSKAMSSKVKNGMPPQSPKIQRKKERLFRTP
jgi:serine/threonine protein kinase